MTRWLPIASLFLACSKAPTVPTVEPPPEPTAEATPGEPSPLTEVQFLYDAGKVDEARARWFELDEATRASAPGQALDRRFARVGVAFSGKELGLLEWTPEPPFVPADLQLVGFWEVSETEHPKQLEALQYMHDRFGPLGVTVAAVTRALDGADEASIAAALAASAPTTPAATDPSWLVAAPLQIHRSDRAEAVAVRRGKVLWSGPITRLDPKLVGHWLAPDGGTSGAPAVFDQLSPEEIEGRLMAWGERVYRTGPAACATCHLDNGQGVKGAFPPLVGQEAFLGDCARAASIVLNGLAGPIEVDGVAFHGVMPPQGKVLDDTQVASVLTYVRNAWGNDYGPCLPSEVAAVRAER